MRVSYEILKRFLPRLSLTPEEIAEVLMNQGFVVEESFSARSLFFVPLHAGILEEARKEGVFTCCTVKVGSRTFQVLVHPWGIPEVGSKVLLSIQNGTPLFFPMRGEKEKEVLDFLITLPSSFKDGDEISEALLGNDIVFEIEITANRGDCLSVLGIARELATFCRIPLEFPKVQYTEKNIRHDFRLENEAPHLCPYYTGRYIASISVKPSPFWIVKELVLLGMRPINNVVDITNLVMFEMGQPLHAFDAARIGGRVVRVREAGEGESIVTLDGEERVLRKGTLLIADALRPIAIAGVMGGRDTEVSPATREIFLEAALFDRISVRRTAWALGMRTEASARFERGVDPLGVMQAASRALALLEEEGRAEVAGEWLVSGQPPFEEREVCVSSSLISQRLHCEVPPEESICILKNLGFQVAREGEVLRIHVPSWRSDVREAMDIVEEVGRVYGYDKIVASFPSFAFDPGNVPKEEVLKAKIREHLVHRGLYEVVTLSLMEQESAEMLGFDAHECVAVLNPLSQEHALLRPSLFPPLFEVVQTNARRGRRSPGFFEIGHVFLRGKENVPLEEERLGIMLWSCPEPSLWQGVSLDLFSLKGILEEIGELSGLWVRGSGLSFLRGEFPPFLEQEASFTVYLPSAEGEPLGWGGKVSGELLQKFDVDGELYYLELRLGLLAQAIVSPSFQEFYLPSFPSVVRDVSIVVDLATPWSFVASLVEEEAQRLNMALEEFVLFDAFSGNPLPPGKKGFAFRLVFRAPDRTLQDEEVGRWVQALKESLKSTGRVVLREEMTTPHE